jgi:hypothetical protein
MNRLEAASPQPLSPLDRRRATLRARPSGLKGRYRDRYATDLQPALDPAASTAPHHTAARAAAGQLPARRAAPSTNTKIKSLQPSLYGSLENKSQATCSRVTR